MKIYIVIFIVILIACVFITLVNYTIYCNVIPSLKSSSKNYISTSRVGGRGVFAGQKYNKGDIIEIAYFIKDTTDLYNNTIIRDYLFQFDDTNSLLCLGNGSLYSHSDIPNCTYELRNDMMYFICINPIEKDEEIFISYGDEWWNDRQNRINKL
jgi:hypothetical protein